MFRFEWDRHKAASNLNKHRVGFDEATSVFGDALARIFDDEGQPDAEAREIIVGYSAAGRLLLVSFIERADNTIRIISARLATRRERRNHEQTIGS